jgi:hypothetical protein
VRFLAQPEQVALDVLAQFRHLVEVDGRAEHRHRAALVGVGQLLRADGDGDLSGPGLHGHARHSQGRRRRRARVLDVDDRGAGGLVPVERHLAADHLLPGQDALSGVGEHDEIDVPGVTPASSSASFTAERASVRTSDSGAEPNGVIPVPTIHTSTTPASPGVTTRVNAYRRIHGPRPAQP